MPQLPFDISKIDAEPQSTGEYEQLPEGEYEVRVTNTENRVSKNGNEYLNVEFTITGPTHAGRKVWDNHFIYGEKEFPRTRFKWLAEACGLGSIKATEELHGRECIVNVIHAGPDKKYENVDRYAQIVGGPTKPSAPASAGPKPPWAA